MGPALTTELAHLADRGFRKTRKCDEAKKYLDEALEEIRAGQTSRPTKPSLSATSPQELVSTPPIPPEPSPRLAEKVGEVPALEARLVTDKGYVTAWTADYSFERETLLTAISEIVAYGSLHTDLDTAIKKAGLTEAIAIMNGILVRNGKLSADFTSKVEAYLAANETAPRRGLWNPDEKGKPLVDATALAMWLHPNEAPYVRERMLALVNGPFPYTGKNPMARRWLAHVGDVAERLTSLGAFTKTDCTALGFEFHEPTTQGKTSASCDPPADDKNEAASDIKAKPDVVPPYDVVEDVDLAPKNGHRIFVNVRDPDLTDAQCAAIVARLRPRAGQEGQVAVRIPLHNDQSRFFPVCVDNLDGQGVQEGTARQMQRAFDKKPGKRGGN